MHFATDGASTDLLGPERFLHELAVEPIRQPKAVVTAILAPRGDAGRAAGGARPHRLSTIGARAHRSFVLRTATARNRTAQLPDKSTRQCTTSGVFSRALETPGGSACVAAQRTPGELERIKETGYREYPEHPGGTFPRRIMVGGAIAAIAMSFALLAVPAMANNLHQFGREPNGHQPGPGPERTADECKDR